jgi:putative oxidoreductase
MAYRVRALAFFVEPAVSGDASRAVLAIRAAVGGVFLVSGATKFLFENQGPGRFARLGFPAAREIAAFVGATEMVCGALLVLGLLVRLAAATLAVDMVVALVTTKIPLLFGAGPEPVSSAPKTGFWAFAFQARLDGTMLLACMYLIVTGAGLWSLDAVRARRR